MTSEIRVENLKSHIGYLNKKGDKTLKSIEERFNVNSSYISQLLNGRRNFGESAARKMEKQFGLDDFYFEKEHSNDGGFRCYLYY